MEKYDEKESESVKKAEKVSTDSFHNAMKGHHSGSEEHISQLKEHGHEIEEGYQNV